MPAQCVGKLTPFDLRERLHELKGLRLSVWLAYWLHSDQDGIAWPSLTTLAKETGHSADRISEARAALVGNGWLVPQSPSHAHGSKGRFIPKTFVVKIPNRADEMSLWTECPQGQEVGNHTDEMSAHHTYEMPPRSTTRKKVQGSATDMTLTESQREKLLAAFPWVEIDSELAKMRAWIDANASRRPRNFYRFAFNWLARVPSPSKDGGKPKRRTLEEERERRRLTPEGEALIRHAQERNTL